MHTGCSQISNSKDVAFSNMKKGMYGDTWSIVVTRIIIL